ncbi:CAAX protease self-immunity [Granulicatella balaenopterae]|uniref:CAAX protease self-immunity n=1 Tax=Granulicatella balaenopterae TaxID=137733 RepID=A0A1H9I9S1_9LACT|nr:CPBP family intramembrane glutamic endopeptidase [Granulicatella balaenopterae]SEQ71145.1 CAAX protease self-immunity [Granulicatella balaenopterae]
MTEQKMKYLKSFDIVFITLIMFGVAIKGSTIGYLDLINGVANIDENLTFSSMDDWITIGTELVELAIVFGYLYFRKFDFSVWKFKFNWQSVAKGLLIYILASLLMDISSIIFGFNTFPLTFTGEFNMIRDLLSQIHFTTIPFSFLNGFFEEIFFLGICLSVKEEHIHKALIYSLLVRISFHTYQGIASASTIGIGIGLLFYVAYRKYSKDNLTPIIVAHILSDIFGAGLLGFILY